MAEQANRATRKRSVEIEREREREYTRGVTVDGKRAHYDAVKPRECILRALRQNAVSCCPPGLISSKSETLSLVSRRAKKVSRKMD